MTGVKIQTNKNGIFFSVRFGTWSRLTFWPRLRFFFSHIAMCAAIFIGRRGNFVNFFSCASIPTRALISVYSQTHFDTLFSVQSIITSFRIWDGEKKELNRSTRDRENEEKNYKQINIFHLSQKNFVAVFTRDGQVKKIWATIADVKEFSHREFSVFYF